MKSLSFQTSKPNGRLWLSMYFPDLMASCLISSDGQANSNSFHEYFSSIRLARAQVKQRTRTKSNFIFKSELITVWSNSSTGKSIETEIIYKVHDDFITEFGFLFLSFETATRQTGFSGRATTKSYVSREER